VKRLLIAVLAATAVFGQNVDRSLNRRLEKSWKLSLIPLVAAQSLDAASSWGHPESNPLLASAGGRFGAQSAGIKLSFVGAATLTEYLIMRRHPGKTRLLIDANRANAVLTFGLAAHNFVVTR
jgi:hypothetical protein